MGNHSQVQLTFWGVRGSIPVPEADFLAYGGNTTCIEVRAGDTCLVIDAGTGARGLGTRLQEESAGASLQVNLLMTHFHWDHIQGLPYFLPLYTAANQVVFHSGLPAEHLRRTLEGEMSRPYFPVDFESLPAKRAFVDLNHSPIRSPDLSVRPFPLNHPQGATGYRIEAGGIVITHASDLEHGHAVLDQTLREHAQDADLLIYDAQYTPEEYVLRKGWGHSTWQEATRVACECNVKRLILFHHDPSHNDERMREIEQHAKQQFGNTEAAREGLKITF